VTQPQITWGFENGHLPLNRPKVSVGTMCLSNMSAPSRPGLHSLPWTDICAVLHVISVHICSVTYTPFIQ
jgi:hypothetical protein